MTNLISYVGNAKTIEKLESLNDKLNPGEPILAIDNDPDIGSYSPLIATYDGQYVKTPFMSSDLLYSVSILAQEAATFEVLNVHSRSQGAKVRLGRIDSDKHIRLLFKDSHFPRISLQVETQSMFGSEGILYFADEIYVGRDEVVNKLVEMIR